MINRWLVTSKNDDDADHYEALFKRQTKDNKNKDTFINYASFLIGSAIADQCRDGEPWTHCTVVGRGDYNHNKRSDIIHITKTCQIVSRSRKHIKTTHIMAEQYL